jgi:hypothetical protein
LKTGARNANESSVSSLAYGDVDGTSDPVTVFREANFNLYTARHCRPGQHISVKTTMRTMPSGFPFISKTLEKKHPLLVFDIQKGSENSQRWPLTKLTNNVTIKGDGGAIDVNEDPTSLRRCVVAGPAVSHLVV